MFAARQTKIGGAADGARVAGAMARMPVRACWSWRAGVIFP
ncbi:hypothetical protein M218_08650 [Burkholderia pseudomallei MSHR338]|nr:hypothetical protein M218_08650 [Burkholderia pseudomallei MSHR338]